MRKIVLFSLIFFLYSCSGTPEVCKCKKKAMDRNIGFSEQLDCEEKYGNYSTWGKKCCKEDDLYYHNEILDLPEAWYKEGNCP